MQDSSSLVSGSLCRVSSSLLGHLTLSLVRFLFNALVHVARPCPDSLHNRTSALHVFPFLRHLACVLWPSTRVGGTWFFQDHSGRSLVQACFECTTRQFFVAVPKGAVRGLNGGKNDNLISENLFHCSQKPGSSLPDSPSKNAAWLATPIPSARRNSPRWSVLLGAPAPCQPAVCPLLGPSFG